MRTLSRRRAHTLIAAHKGDKRDGLRRDEEKPNASARRTTRQWQTSVSYATTRVTTPNCRQPYSDLPGTGTLGRCSRIKQSGKRCSLYRCFYPLWIRHQPENVSGLRLSLEKMGKYPARSIGKELVFVLLLWQKRDGNGHRSFIAGNLVGKTPIGAVCIERIEGQVAPRWRVELRGELQRRIVDDGTPRSAIWRIAEDLPLPVSPSRGGGWLRDSEECGTESPIKVKGIEIAGSNPRQDKWSIVQCQSTEETICGFSGL
jgi:hypothetical protein